MKLTEAEQIRIFNRSLSECASGFSLRVSTRFMHPKFALLRAKHLSATASFKIKDFCSRSVMRGVQPQYEESDILVAKTATLKNGFLDWSEAQSVNEEFYEAVKYRAGLRRGDILVSSTGVGSLGKIDVYDRDGRAIADSHISIVRLKDRQIEPEFLAHLMRHRLVQWQMEQGLTGATNQIDIYPSQIAALQVPLFPKRIGAKLSDDLRKLSLAMATARSSLKKPSEIINEILCREFCYPLRQQKVRTEDMFYMKSLSAISSSFTLRDSAKFHHQRFEMTDEFFAKTPHHPIKNYLLVPIRLGATATKDDLVEQGSAFYVHPGSTKSQGVIDLDDCHRISLEFFEKNKRRFLLRPGDLVLNRAGEGTIGKSGIFEDKDEPAIFSDFTMRLRFDETMNPRFASYFFRSIMFQSQIEREKRGMGNMTNIFPQQVERMLIPLCDRDLQDELVAQIDKELRSLEVSRKRIEDARYQIDSLITQAVDGQNG